MHHSLRAYSRYRELFLRCYIFQAKWTRLPVIGRLVRKVANLYGGKVSGAYLLTLREAEEIVDSSARLAVGPCTCREVFRNCDSPRQAEIILGLSGNVFVEERGRDYREIDGEEARNILRRCHEKGLIHTLIRCRRDFYALCNCCACCCVPLRLSREYGIGNALVRKKDIVRVYRRRQLA